MRRLVPLACLCLLSSPVQAQRSLLIDTPSPAPRWALLQRQVLDANASACRVFFEKYFDARGYLQCVTRWGGNDGPDDAIECCNDWPLVHALGGSEAMLEMFLTAWEGHLRQYTEAKTTEVPLARDGMYYKEFPVMFDWVHNGGGLRAFSQLGLARPLDPRFRQRVFRYAGFYMNEDAGAVNYDPKHRIIRSLFNGSRGPLLRRATALDWAGDPIEVEGRFLPKHGEENYEQMLEHFEDYNDIVGDHPQNLCATSLALYAYMLSGKPKYKSWLLEYVDAWLERTKQNNNVIPTNVGLDGRIGSATAGKWYGGTYGWAFSVKVPQTGATAHRNTHQLGLSGFGNAYLLTGDSKYVDIWRTMMHTINGHARMEAGQKVYPTMYGDQGWYAFRSTPYRHGAQEIWYWSMRVEDRAPLRGNRWLSFLDGRDPGYPEQLLAADLEVIRQRVQQIREDPTSPDTRLADDPLVFNPARAQSLLQLMCGGLPSGAYATPIHARVRYFDPVGRRAGLPANVAALVTKLGATSTELMLVNLSPVARREVILQGGFYGEHRIESVSAGELEIDVDGPHVRVLLQPGCGSSLTLTHRPYANPPTLRHPWSW